MQIEFRPIEYGKDYDIVNNPDKYMLFLKRSSWQWQLPPSASGL